MVVMLNCYLQTESLVYEIETDDMYDDFYENKSLFDFRDYPKEAQFFLSCQ